MALVTENQLRILTELCNLPTAPYSEQHVIAYLLAWASAAKRRGPIEAKRDPAGNVYLHYRRDAADEAGEKSTPLPPLVVEAHMDHPGFRAVGPDEQGRLRAEFRGGVKPSYFAGATAAFWVNNPSATDSIAPVIARGRWVPVRVLEAAGPEGERNYTQVLLEAPPAAVPPGSLGMWALPEAFCTGREQSLFAARVCDDLAGVAAGVCLLEELIAKKIPGHVIVLASRAEEVGFAGVLAAARNGWVPREARVVGIETSKGSAAVPQGGGPVVRVGDRAGIFSAGLTHFLSQAAGAIGDEDSSFAWQRKLMDGGTCNSTAFTAYGYDAAGVCVALGNYHNMTIEGEAGWGDGAKAGPGIASETIHLGDFAGLVRILVEAVRRMPTYQPAFGAMRDRLEKLHATEQRDLLFATSDQPEAGRYRQEAPPRGAKRTIRRGSR